MTAMCDVAFLLLTFFMLATKFKPEDAVKVAPPSSVSSDVVPDKNAFEVLFDKEGKVFFTYSDADRVSDMIDYANTQQNLGLTPAEVKNFKHIVETSGIGVPFSQLKQLLDYDPETLKQVKQPGIPMTDSTHNELRIWVTCLLKSGGNLGAPENVLVKGDNGAKFPNFKEVLRAFTDNKVFHFKLVTAMADAPPGTALYEERHKK
jgi:biopolymer transport protein ExbD